jgi:hypothetical protein
MSKLQFLPPPTDPKDIKDITQYLVKFKYELELWANGNINGSDIYKATVPPDKLTWREVPIPLVLPASPYETVNTTGVNVGAYFRWNPTNFPTNTGGLWYLEATIYSENAAATATCTITGSADFGTAATAEITPQRIRSSALTMPTAAQNIWVKLKTSDGTYKAYLSGARLIYVP